MKYSMKILFALSAFAIAACSNESFRAVPAPQPAPGPSGQVQILHAASDAPTVNIVIDGLETDSDVDYKQSTIEYNLSAGTHTVEVIANLDSGPTSVFGPADVTVAADTVTTVAAVGPVAVPLDVAIASKPDVAPAAGMARVFIVHLAPGPMDLPVDIYVDAYDEDNPTMIGDSTPIQLAFKGSSDPIELMPGEYQVRVTLRDSLEAVYDSGPVELSVGDDFTVAAVPNVSGGDAAVTLLALDPGGSFGAGASAELLDIDTPTGLRIGHLSPDTGPVDVIVDGEIYLDNVAYPGITPIVAEDAGTYTVSITDNEDPPATLLEETDLDLAAGVWYDVFAIGLSVNEEEDNEAEDFAVEILTPDARPVALFAKVRIIHASPGADNVDIYLLDPALMGDVTGEDAALEDVAFGTVTEYLSLPEGDYDVIVTPTGETTAAISQNISIGNGLVYTAIARDPEPESMDFALEVLVDELVDPEPPLPL